MMDLGDRTLPGFGHVVSLDLGAVAAGVAGPPVTFTGSGLLGRLLLSDAGRYLLLFDFDDFVLLTDARSFFQTPLRFEFFFIGITFSACHFNNLLSIFSFLFVHCGLVKLHKERQRRRLYSYIYEYNYEI